MKEVVFEVIFGVIVLALLVVVIQLFRGNLDIIGSTAEKADKTAKVEANDLGVNKNSMVKGSDVISAIRYYKSSHENITVIVNNGMGTRSYVFNSTFRDSYDPLTFSIQYEDNYNLDLSDPAKIIYTKTW